MPRERHDILIHGATSGQKLTQGIFNLCRNNVICYQKTHSVLPTDKNITLCTVVKFRLENIKLL